LPAHAEVLLGCCWGAANAIIPYQKVMSVVDPVSAATRDLSKEMLWLKHMLQAYVSSVSDVLEVCCNCFIWMLQKYIGDIAYVVYVASVFWGMLQVFQWFIQNVLSVLSVREIQKHVEIKTKFLNRII
jgi:hypothetical protein